MRGCQSSPKKYSKKITIQRMKVHILEPFQFMNPGKTKEKVMLVVHKKIGIRDINAYNKVMMIVKYVSMSMLFLSFNMVLDLLANSTI